MSNVKGVPEGLHAVTPSIAIDGCAEAIDLYKKAFGAEETGRAVDPSGKKVWHASIRIGDSQVFVNDVFPEMGGTPDKARFWLYSEDADAAFERAKSAGLAVKMPMTDMFWGDRLGTLVDKWGNEWTCAQRVKEMTPEEMKTAQDAFVASMKQGK